MEWVILAVVLLALAGLLLWQAAARRKAAGVPGGRIISMDTHPLGPVEKALYDPESGLTGKPDYLVARGRGVFIPVEVKSSRLPEAPYDSHIYQVAAYCLLVARTHGKRPPYGVLHYVDASRKSRTFAIDYTPTLERSLLDLLDEIRACDRRKNIHRSHEQPARCRRCGYRSNCDEALA